MNDLQKRIDQVNRPTSKIMSADGQLLFSVSAENRIPLKLPQIPKFVRNAVLAAEDKRFYQHSGVDFTAFARIIFVNTKAGKLSQGGSTITMQLVKLLFNGSTKTFRRKMNDIAYAQAMEQNLPKDQILELYLNKVFFGEGAYGIGEAAKVYFNKDVNDLTIGEAAMLARCIRRPSSENPIRDLDKATANRDIVLNIMRDEKFITEEQCEKAEQEKPHINPKPPSAGVYKRPGAEYFVDHVLEFVKKDLDLDLMDGGYTIETTLDCNLNELAYKSMRQVVDDNQAIEAATKSAFMVMDSDGRILAEVGGLNYKNHQQNIITHGSLQPGSGFKPILYATALKAGVINMDSRLSNAHIYERDDLGRVWEPKNSSPSEDQATYSLRNALASSINLCAVHTIQQVTPAAVVQTAYDVFGFRSKLAPYDPLALGASAVAPVEMAEAYSVFMLRGDRVRPQPVLRISDSEGNGHQGVRASQNRGCLRFEHLRRNGRVARSRRSARNGRRSEDRPRRAGQDGYHQRCERHAVVHRIHRRNSWGRLGRQRTQDTRHLDSATDEARSVRRNRNCQDLGEDHEGRPRALRQSPSCAEGGP